MTKAELIAAIADKGGASNQTQAKDALEAFIRFRDRTP